MTRRQRRVHLITWTLLGPALAALVTAAVAVRSAQQAALVAAPATSASPRP